MDFNYDYVCTGLTILDILGRHIDRIPEGGNGQIIDQIRITPAGTAAGPAVIGARYGLKTALVGAIGRDDMGLILETMLKANGVETSLIQHRTDMPTSATMLTINSQGQRPNFHAIGSHFPPDLTEIKNHLQPLQTWLKANSRRNDFVLIQGDFGACYIMVNFAFKIGLIPVYSTTERKMKEEILEDGQVKLTHRFRHRIFRRYER